MNAKHIIRMIEQIDSKQTIEENTKIILTNSFSINMLTTDTVVRFKKITLEEAKEALSKGFTSAIGHADLASILENLLGLEVKMSRITVSLGSSFELIVAQYRGPRLPEGTKELPSNAAIEFWKVTA